MYIVRCQQQPRRLDPAHRQDELIRRDGKPQILAVADVQPVDPAAIPRRS
jgi:hypothetical protein